MKDPSSGPTTTVTRAAMSAAAMKSLRRQYWKSAGIWFAVLLALVLFAGWYLQVPSVRNAPVIKSVAFLAVVLLAGLIIGWKLHPLGTKLERSQTSHARHVHGRHRTPPKYSKLVKLISHLARSERYGDATTLTSDRTDVQ